MQMVRSIWVMLHLHIFPADVTTRFLKQNGVEAYYVCASDDFGTPILIQSEKEGKTPAEYVAHWNKRDYDDFTAFGIEF